MYKKSIIVGIVLLSIAFISFAEQAESPNHHRRPLPVEFVDTSHVTDFVHGTSAGDGGAGVAWFDFNNDGWIDFYAANGIGSDDGLMRNNGDGTFTNIAAQAGIADGNGSAGVAAADLDNDGDDDIVVTGDAAAYFGVHSLKPIRIYENNGDETFTDVTPASGLEISNEVGTVLQPVLGDINNDGLLDLFVTAPASLTRIGILEHNVLFLNIGDLKFQDISAGSGTDYAGGSCPVAFTHYDDDGWIDLLVADCNIVGPEVAPGVPAFQATPLRLLKNNGDLTFTRVIANLPDPAPPETQPFPPVERGFWMCVGLGDIENDGDLDLFSTNVGGTTQRHGLFRRDSDGNYTSIEVEAGLANHEHEFSWGCTFADFNNDGWEDLIWAGNNPNLGRSSNSGRLYVNNRDGTFREEQLPVDLEGKYTGGVVAADYNNDGFPDVLMGNASYDYGFITDLNATPTLLRTRPNRNRSITIRLEGRPPSNRSAIGAQVRVKVGRHTLLKEVRAGASYLSQDSPWLTFGLDRRRRARLIKVTWPSGKVEKFRNVRGGRTITIVEGEGIVDVDRYERRHGADRYHLD